ncbi:MAG: alpha/beta hydrolase fold domain-containing protein [Bacteroidetes bacterium]|nr:alpha/beta hydrolase fold domain-containing protein [Bacteroidota bacterium]
MIINETKGNTARFILNPFFMRLWIPIFVLLLSCEKSQTRVPDIQPEVPPQAYQGNISISHNNINVDLVIDKPALAEVNVLLVFHGTVLYDSNIITAATNILENFKSILEREDFMIVSVAYPGENLLIGDNIVQAEAALLWVKERASKELNVGIKKIFIAGHSQGGYLATRLNTMHATNGVIANAPGPLNLVYRCQLEESGQIASGASCTKIRNLYGTTSSNPNAYMQRSLLNFTGGFKSDILFVQGLNDSTIQMYSWPSFKQDVLHCTDCQNSEFLEVVGGEHASLFSSTDAKAAFNTFINKH